VLTLLLYLLRSANRGAIAGGAGVALTLGWAPLAADAHPELSDAATIVRLALVSLVIGLSFVLDDPAVASTATLPTAQYVLAALRLVPATGFAIVVWTSAWIGCRLALEPEARPLLPFGGLLLEGIGLLAVTFWLAGTRWGDANGRGGVFAAPAVVVLLIAVVLLPGAMTVFPPPGAAGWDGSRLTWAAVLATGLTGMIVTIRRWTSG
jgi:hypothetical protein